MSNKKNRRKTVVKKNDEPAVQENPIDKIRQMEAELETLKKGRIKELLSQREAIDKELRQLGHGTREIVPKMEAEKPAKAPKKITRKRDPNKPCPICGETGHDARRHRGDKKRAQAATA